MLSTEFRIRCKISSSKSRSKSLINAVCFSAFILWQVCKCNKIDCGMNAQQSSYLPSVHHVMGHVTRDNCSSNKKAASLVRMYNQPSHVTSAKKRIRIKKYRKNCLFC